MIRFSAFLVVAAIGLLVAGVVISKLLLVYLAIGVSGLALLALAAGAALNWQELFGSPKPADALPEPVPAVSSAQAPVRPAQPEPHDSPRPTATVGSGATARPGPSLVGYPPVGAEPPAPEAPAEAVPPAESAASPGPSQGDRHDPDAEDRNSPEDQQDAQTRQTLQAGPDLQLEVTVVPGVPRYHNARCILIRFMGEKDLEKMTLAAAREAGCTPCRACLPDQPGKAPE